jgi:hypothetical protein
MDLIFISYTILLSNTETVNPDRFLAHLLLLIDKLEEKFYHLSPTYKIRIWSCSETGQRHV